MSHISLTYDKLFEIISTTTKQEKYLKCSEIYCRKFPQQEEDKVELPKEEQSKFYLGDSKHLKFPFY